MNLNPEQDEKCQVHSWICTKLQDSMKIETHSDLSDNPQIAEEVGPVIAVNGDQTVFAVILLLLLLL